VTRGQPYASAELNTSAVTLLCRLYATTSRRNDVIRTVTSDVTVQSNVDFQNIFERLCFRGAV